MGVLLQLDRNSDFLSLGGRPPASASWNVSFTNEGEVNGLTQNVTGDCGFDKSGCSFGMSCANAYNSNIFWFHFNNDKAVTSKALNTIMRAPGEFQGSLFMEA